MQRLKPSLLGHQHSAFWFYHDYRHSSTSTFGGKTYMLQRLYMPQQVRMCATGAAVGQ
jgi:hypothetical protein